MPSFRAGADQPPTRILGAIRLALIRSSNSRKERVCGWIAHHLRKNFTSDRNKRFRGSGRQECLRARCTKVRLKRRVLARLRYHIRRDAHLRTKSVPPLHVCALWSPGMRLLENVSPASLSLGGRRAWTGHWSNIGAQPLSRASGPESGNSRPRCLTHLRRCWTAAALAARAGVSESALLGTRTVPGHGRFRSACGCLCRGGQRAVRDLVRRIVDG